MATIQQSRSNSKTPEPQQFSVYCANLQFKDGKWHWGNFGRYVLNSLTKVNLFMDSWFSRR
jgi:hypothetical protein